MIEAVSLTESFAFYFNNIQAYNAFTAPLAALEKLIRDIRIRFESIDIHANAWSIVDDPIILTESLPQDLESGQLLVGKFISNDKSASR